MSIITGAAVGGEAKNWIASLVLVILALVLFFLVSEKKINWKKKG